MYISTRVLTHHGWKSDKVYVIYSCDGKAEFPGAINQVNLQKSSSNMLFFYMLKIVTLLNCEN